MDLADEKIHYQFGETIYKKLVDTINNKQMRTTRDENVHDLEFYMRTINDDGNKVIREDFTPILEWKISNTDLEHIKGTIKANIKDPSITMNELNHFENEKWLVLFHKTDTKPLAKEFQEKITQKLLSKVYEPEKINTLKSIVCDYYLGELIWLSKNNSTIEYMSANKPDFDKLLHSPEKILTEKGTNDNGTYYFIYLPKEI